MTQQEQQIKELKAEINELKSDINTEAKKAKAQASKKLDSTRAGIIDFAEEVGARARVAYENSKDSASKTLTEYENSIRLHPLKSVAIALGSGMAVSALSRMLFRK